MHQLFPHAIVQFLAYDMWKMDLIVEMRGAHREICGRIVRIWCRKNESSWKTLLNQSQAHLKRDGMNTYVSLGWVNGLMSPATLWLTITQVRTSDWTLAWLTWNNHRDHRTMEMNDLTGKISQGMSSYLMLFDCFREGIPGLLQQRRHWKLHHLMFSDLFPLQTPPWVVLCVSSELWGYPDGQPDGGLGSWISDVLSHSLDDFGCVFWIRIILCSASGRQYFLAGHHLQQPGVLLQEGMGQASTVPCCPYFFWWFLAGRKIPWCPELFETSSQIRGKFWTRGAVNQVASTWEVRPLPCGWE